MKKLIVFFFISFFSSLTYGQLMDSLKAYFQFGGNFLDSSPSGINATNNACNFGTDRNGLPNETLNNVTGSGYVSFNDNSVKKDLPISMSTWVKLDSYTVGTIFMSDNEYNNYHGYWMVLNAAGQIGVNIAAGLGGQNSSNRRTFLTNEVLSLGVWHHVVAVLKDYNDMDVYIDCNKATGTYTGTGSTTMSYSNYDSWIAGSIGNNWNPAGVYLDGEMDQFAIWNRELSANEITQLCNSENSLNTAILENETKDRVLINVVDLMGREVDPTGVTNAPLIYMYSDGTIERKFSVE